MKPDLRLIARLYCEEANRKACICFEKKKPAMCPAFLEKARTAAEQIALTKGQK